MNQRPTLCFLLLLAACSRGPSRAPALAAPRDSDRARCMSAGLERWTDAPVRVYLLDGHTLVSDGREVGVFRGPGFEKTCSFGLPEGRAGEHFVGFAGRYPEQTFSVVTGAEASRLLWLAPGSWKEVGSIRSRRVSIAPYRGGALWLSRPDSGDDYELGVQGADIDTPISKAGGSAACPKRLIAPIALGGTPFGEAGLLGRVCGATPPRFAVEVFPENAFGSQLFELPPGVNARAFALTWRAFAVGGARGDTGWVAIHGGDTWTEQPPLPSAVTALALGTQGELWAATEAVATEVACGAGFDASNLWKRTPSGWRNIALPQSAGRVIKIDWEPDDEVWVTTETALYRSSTAPPVLRWSEPCR